MNKKFLSAILFGALMVSSTGTFVSCKDYDDDIDRIDKELTEVKSQIAALQKLVGEGKWVANISSIENGFTITMSDGTTQTVTGINGKDGVAGKNGTEWTIGEDGFWYKDGEKTASQAVAKDGEDGKAGVTAPSPTINADGFWVIYSWDAAKGEFVPETTTISAQGTSAYVVAKDGVYVLHIADETGAFQDITLPATSDSFVVAAPGSAVRVYFEQANWALVTSKADKEMLAKLTEEFPEIANYKKGDLLKQGGNLPILITPANVELTDKFSFALQSIKGEISEATLSNPVKGMPANSEVDQWGKITTRAVNSEDCFWTLSVEPALNKKGDKYVGFEDPHSLVVKNEKGTVVKTGFAYQLSIEQNSDVTIATEATNVDNADAIDVFAANKEGKSVFSIEHGLNGKFILEAVEPIDVEKYQITIDGSKLMIGNMPADQTSISLKLKLTALGLNGSVAAATTTLTIGQEIVASGKLADKTVTLSSKNSYMQNVRWNIADLGFTSVQLDQFLKANKVMKLTYIDEESGEETAFNDYDIYAYNKDGNATTDYKAAVTFGFSLDSRDYVPRDYAIRLEAASTPSNAVIYVAEATLTVNNPTTTVIKLAEAFVDPETKSILQITGTPAATITYTMANGFVLTDAAIDEFVDMDANPDDASTSWIKSDGKTLEVNKYNYNNKDEQQLYKTRNFKVKYHLFGNANNTDEMEFKAVVLSEVYNSDATKAVVMTDSKLSAVFSADAKVNTIKIASAVEKAILAAGPDRGKTYSLFSQTADGTEKYTYDYSDPKSSGDYVVKGKNFVEIAPADLITFGYVQADLDEALTDGKKFYVKVANWATIWNVAKTYYNTDGSVIKVGGVAKVVTDADKNAVAVYNEYKAKIDFAYTTEDVPGKVTARDNRVADVTVAFADKNTAEKYATLDPATYTIVAKSSITEDIPSGQVAVAVKMTVTDIWGMKMVRNFDVILKTK